MIRWSPSGGLESKGAEKTQGKVLERESVLEGSRVPHRWMRKQGR